MASIDDTRIDRILEVLPDLLNNAESRLDLQSETMNPKVNDLVQATGEDPSSFFQDYRRMMDIYFAIKISGVAKHIKRQKTLQPAVQEYFDKARARFASEGEEGPIAELVGSENLQRYAGNLSSSGFNDHIESFSPAEEQAVRKRLADIETLLA